MTRLPIYGHMKRPMTVCEETRVVSADSRDKGLSERLFHSLTVPLETHLTRTPLSVSTLVPGVSCRNSSARPTSRG